MASPGLAILGPAPPQPLAPTGAFPLLPGSVWYSPFLMIHDTTSSELNNNLGFAIHLGLGSLHERFFSLVVTVFESQALRILSALALVGWQ